MPNIALVWDFDGTLTPVDSTTKVVEFFRDGDSFWHNIKLLRGDKDKTLPTWEHVLASDAPIWMHALSQLAFEKKVPLNPEFFKIILPQIPLYAHTITFFQAIKKLETTPEFQAVDLRIHHFIVSAGLKELIEQIFPKDMITWTFGCRYKIVAWNGKVENPESIPVFCMDETMKTRSLFEIAKGSFNDSKKQVNDRVAKDKLWAPFDNIVYIGDGDTDIPALSLVRKHGGLGVAVYDPNMPLEKRQSRFKKMRFDKRTDLITAADFSLKSELFEYLRVRCNQIRQRYEAESVVL